MSEGGKLTLDELAKTCGDLPAFRRLDEDERRQLLEISHERHFAPGERVIEQAGRSQSLWILLKGKCEVVKRSHSDGPVTLAQLEPQSVFGEMSFFSPAPHSASVVAKTQVRLLSIARMDYERLLAEDSTAAYKLAFNVMQSLADRLRRMDDWVAELACSANHTNGDSHDEQVPEWSEFRKKLFEAWNL